MPRKKVEKPQAQRKVLARSPEMLEVSRQLATVALARVEQDGHLSVRQREQLRRALSTAGDMLGWIRRAAGSKDSVSEVGKDVLKMAKVGAKAMAQDLAADLASKRTEMDQVMEAAAAARELAEDPDATYPTEMTYYFTARNASQVLVTKTETIEAYDAKEALSASESIERNIAGRQKLADLMVLDLEAKQGQIEVMTRTLPDFVKFSHQLLREVLVTLQ
jgi:TPR repeat protein